MPYKSKAQARAFHAKEAAGEISPAVVEEFDAASKGKMGNLPDRVKKKRPSARAKVSSFGPAMAKLRGER